MRLLFFSFIAALSVFQVGLLQASMIITFEVPNLHPNYAVQLSPRTASAEYIRDFMEPSFQALQKSAPQNDFSYFQEPGRNLIAYFEGGDPSRGVVLTTPKPSDYYDITQEVHLASVMPPVLPPHCPMAMGCDGGGKPTNPPTDNHPPGNHPGTPTGCVMCNPPPPIPYCPLPPKETGSNTPEPGTLVSVGLAIAGLVYKKFNA